MSFYRRCLFFYMPPSSSPFMSPFRICLVLCISSLCIFLLPSLFISSLHMCILFVCVFSVYVPSLNKSCLVYDSCPCVVPLRIYPLPYLFLVHECSVLWISPLRVCFLYICFFHCICSQKAPYLPLTIVAEYYLFRPTMPYLARHYASFKGGTEGGVRLAKRGVRILAPYMYTEMCGPKAEYRLN